MAIQRSDKRKKVGLFFEIVSDEKVSKIIGTYGTNNGLF